MGNTVLPRCNERSISTLTYVFSLQNPTQNCTAPRTCSHQSAASVMTTSPRHHAPRRHFPPDRCHRSPSPALHYYRKSIIRVSIKYTSFLRYIVILSKLCPKNDTVGIIIILRSALHHSITINTWEEIRLTPVACTRKIHNRSIYLIKTMWPDSIYVHWAGVRVVNRRALTPSGPHMSHIGPFMLTHKSTVKIHQSPFYHKSS